jgi:hypothetical protein
MMLKMPSRMMFWTVLLLLRNVWKADPARNQLDIPEMLANVMAHRHLEDARMRLAKPCKPSMAARACTTSSAYCGATGLAKVILVKLLCPGLVAYQSAWLSSPKLSRKVPSRTQSTKVDFTDFHSVEFELPCHRKGAMGLMQRQRPGLRPEFCGV